MSTEIKSRPGMMPSGPLWTRAPTRDGEGQPVADFMVLVPGLRSWPEPRRSDCIARIRALLALESDVVFADLNLKINLLWVSVRGTPGSCTQVAAALCEQVPEARLVAPHPEAYR